MRISKDTPCLFLTAVTHKRLPIFQTDAMKMICALALDEARRSAGLKIFAYAIMPDHIHMITDGSLRSSDVLRYVKGISAKRVLDHLKANNFAESLKKLQQSDKERNYKHSVWEHHSNVFLITSESTFMQKVNYIHNNPVNEDLSRNCLGLFVFERKNLAQIAIGQ